MRRRLLASTALIALATVLVLGIPLAFVEANRERDDAVSRLEREADTVAAAIDDRLEARQPIDTAAVRAARPVRPRGHDRPAAAPAIRVGTRDHAVTGSPPRRAHAARRA